MLSGKVRPRPMALPFSYCCSCRQVLTLTAAEFPMIFEQDFSTTRAAYANDPLFTLHAPWKGRVLQKAILQTLADRFPSVPVEKVLPGMRINGTRRGDNQGEFDFTHGGRRVECRGTTLAWSSELCNWAARWSNIKFNQDFFDDLYLALHSPGQVDIVLHDGVAGIAESGVKTIHRGNNVNIYGACGTHSAREACQEILQKMLIPPHGCEHIATMCTDSGRIAEMVSQEQLAESYQLSAKCYKGIPLAGHSPCSRALRLQDLAFAVDEKLHMESRFRRDVGASEVVGTLCRQRRGKHRSSADWWRDSIRVEFKSSKMSWVSGRRHWHAHFSTVKFASQGHPHSAVFDELMLGLYAPFGLYLLQYSGDFGRSSRGVATDHLGHAVVVSGPRNEKCPRVALEEMLAKLEQSGCRLLAIVKW